MISGAWIKFCAEDRGVSREFPNVSVFNFLPGKDLSKVNLPASCKHQYYRYYTAPEHLVDIEVVKIVSESHSILF